MSMLVVVVPRDKADKLLRQGNWSPGRCNSYTQTLLRHYPTDDEAMAAGHALPFTWSVEKVTA